MEDRKLENIVVEYLRTLPPNKINQFIQYFNGITLIRKNIEEGFDMVYDSNITLTDKKKVAGCLFKVVRREMDTEYMATQLQLFLVSVKWTRGRF